MTPAQTDVSLRIRRVVSNVLGVPEADLPDSAAQATVPGWDSLAHVQLIVALESEFAVAFAIDEALEMTSVSAIQSAVAAAVSRPGTSRVIRAWHTE